ncbi:MAG: 3-dehydroquinate synthase [Ruminococcaceae bacterium]|nr:3-dehydroquinate synthase [Oscillospiraceae bacterium]
MKTLQVNLGSRSYEILIGRDLLNHTGSYIKKVSNAARVLVVTDDTVKGLYGNTVCASLEAAGFCVKLVSFPAGETTKSMESLVRLYDEGFAFSLTRTDLIVALGGGVIGDLTGFFAATMLRGIPFVQIPTTLLAQVDSSVGGKVAINVPQGKNLVGNFYQPKLVLIDTEVLSSLTDAIFADGMAEVIKYGCIADRALFSLLETFSSRKAMEETLPEIIYTCCDAKRKVVETDELDTGQRLILNFGHTMGHVIEKAYHFTDYTHGQAVAIGMVLAARLGERLLCTPAGTEAAVCRLLAQHHLPTEVKLGTDWEETMKLDKKMQGDEIRFVLLDAIGSAFVQKIKASALHETMKEII